MIALGLSLLFGLGWAFGLLASSDLPAAVRYPAEWIFTLATAFLGVYLFALYILRSSEARQFWTRFFLCKKKGVSGVPSSNTLHRTQWGTASSILSSWSDTLTATLLRRGRKSTNIINSPVTQNPPSTSTNPYSFSSSTGRTVDNYSACAGSSVIGNITAKATTPDLAPVEIELLHRVDLDREDSPINPNSISPSKLPITTNVEIESQVETMSFHDNSF